MNLNETFKQKVNNTTKTYKAKLLKLGVVDYQRIKNIDTLLKITINSFKK